METRPWTGRRVLDVGSGSGVLSFAALGLGARWALGLEIDLPSALQAGQNRGLNDLWPTFVAGSLACLEGGEPFDAALVNVLPERILPDFHHLPRLLKGDGELFFSGILEERRQEVLDALGVWAFRAEEECGEGDWIALRCRR
jgi:ribosomal protein L11 methyltransferase